MCIVQSINYIINLNFTNLPLTFFESVFLNLYHGCGVAKCTHAHRTGGPGLVSPRHFRRTLCNSGSGFPARIHSDKTQSSKYQSILTVFFKYIFGKISLAKLMYSKHSKCTNTICFRLRQVQIPHNQGVALD